MSTSRETPSITTAGLFHCNFINIISENETAAGKAEEGGEGERMWRRR
jgi:hypothetical protein